MTILDEKVPPDIEVLEIFESIDRRCRIRIRWTLLRPHGRTCGRKASVMVILRCPCRSAPTRVYLCRWHAWILRDHPASLRCCRCHHRASAVEV